MGGGGGEEGGRGGEEGTPQNTVSVNGGAVSDLAATWGMGGWVWVSVGGKVGQTRGGGVGGEQAQHRPLEADRVVCKVVRLVTRRPYRGLGGEGGEQEEEKEQEEEEKEEDTGVGHVCVVGEGGEASGAGEGAQHIQHTTAEGPRCGELHGKEGQA